MAKLKYLLLPLAVIFFFFAQGNSQDFWQRTDGLDSVPVTCLAIHSNGDIFAGTIQGVFRSTDNGNGWLKVSNSLMDTTPVSSLVISPNGFIFAGTERGGAFRSLDNGASWEQVNNGFTFFPYYPFVKKLAANSNGFIFASSIGLYRSSSDGTDWTPINDSRLNTVWSLATNSNGHIFAGSLGVFRSTDDGANWTQVLPAFPFPKALSPDKVMKPSDVTCIFINSNGHIFAGFSDWTGKGESYAVRSTDNGNSWSFISKFNRTVIYSIATHSSGEIFVAFQDEGVYHSTDNGVTWSQLNSGLTSGSVFSLATDSNDHIYAGTGNGIYRSVEPLSCPAAKGDLNRDGNLTLLDITRQLNCVFLNSSGYNFCIADSNCDWLLSPVDVVALLRNIFLGAPFPC